MAADTSPITETAQNITRKWEVVDAAWFSAVRGIVERSLPAPKSLEKLSGVIDLYDRARAAGSVAEGIFHTGWGGVWGGSDGDQREVDGVERRVEGWRESRGMDLGGEPWAAAERGERRAWIESRESGDAPKRTPGVRAGIGAVGILPEVGSVVNLERRIESFAGFISVGPATVTAAWVDPVGQAMVSLERGGVLVATGVRWPIV